MCGKLVGKVGRLSRLTRKNFICRRYVGLGRKFPKERELELWSNRKIRVLGLRKFSVYIIVAKRCG